MNRFSHLVVAAVTVGSFASTAAAQGPKAGTVGATKAPTIGSHGPSTGTQTHGGGSSAQGGGAASGKTTTTASGKSAATTTHGASADHSKKPSATTTSGATTTSDATTTAAAAPNAISTKISKNPNQLARINGMLPDGMSLEEASAGFRNQGQFIAALNASKNQGVDFVALKEAMTVDGVSLGQAVRTLLAAPPETETGDEGTTAGVTAGTGTTSGSGSTSGTGTTSGSDSTSGSTSGTGTTSGSGSAGSTSGNTGSGTTGTTSGTLTSQAKRK
jgi:hypothetical protein